MKVQIALLLLSFQICHAGSPPPPQLPPPTADPNSIWQGVTILEHDALLRYSLNDIPGSICALVPDTNGQLTAYLIGNKVLTNNSLLPTISTTPQPLISAVVSGDVAASLSYLPFASLSLVNPIL